MDNDTIRYLRSYGMYYAMTQEEIDAWDKREEMLTHAYLSLVNRRDSLPVRKLLEDND